MAVHHHGLRSAESKMSAIARLAPPATVAEEVRALWGITGYLRKFVEGYSIIAAPRPHLPSSLLCIFLFDKKGVYDGNQQQQVSGPGHHPSVTI